ncbi:hypothetical protein [Micromonospora sp. RHAY321]|nr:hypothetical protein [Micromonospora sp. RHAY321]
MTAWDACVGDGWQDGDVPELTLFADLAGPAARMVLRRWRPA